jgi:hypothetical protein
VNASRRDRRLVAAGVLAVLLALVMVGRLQSRNLSAGDAGPSRVTRSTVATDDRPVMSGLRVVGRMALPGPAVAVAVGEGAVWVLLEQGTLLRVNPDYYQVTGRVELGAPGQGMAVGPLAVGAGAVWVGTEDARVTARVDPVGLRVTARFNGLVVVVAHGVLWSYCCPQGDKPMGFGRVDARTLRRRPPLRVTDASGRRQPVGPLAVGTDAVWTTQAPEDQRLWRVPLGGGPARAVARVTGFAYGIGVGSGAVWVLSGTEVPGSLHDQTGRLRRLDERTGQLTATTPLADLDVGGVNGGVRLVVGDGAVWLAGPYAHGLDLGGILLRVDPASRRVTGWLRDSRSFFHGVVAADPRGAWVADRSPELLHLTAA